MCFSARWRNGVLISILKFIGTGALNTILAWRSMDYGRRNRCLLFDFSLTIRKALRNKIYDGMRIPEGMNVLASICEIHNNRDIFVDPQVFRPERFLPEKVTPDMTFAWLVRCRFNFYVQFIEYTQYDYYVRALTTSFIYETSRIVTVSSCYEE